MFRSGRPAARSDEERREGPRQKSGFHCGSDRFLVCNRCRLTTLAQASRGIARGSRALPPPTPSARASGACDSQMIQPRSQRPRRSDIGCRQRAPTRARRIGQAEAAEGGSTRSSSETRAPARSSPLAALRTPKRCYLHRLATKRRRRSPSIRSSAGFVDGRRAQPWWLTAVQEDHATRPQRRTDPASARWRGVCG